MPFLNAGSGNPALSEPPACGKYSFQGSPNSRILCLPSLYAAKKFGPKWFLIGDDYTWGRLTVDLHATTALRRRSSTRRTSPRPSRPSLT